MAKRGRAKAAAKVVKAAKPARKSPNSWKRGKPVFTSMTALKKLAKDARQLRADHKRAAVTLAKAHGCSVATIRRALARAEGRA